jgi:hypothetical protein
LNAGPGDAKLGLTCKQKHNRLGYADIANASLYADHFEGRKGQVSEGVV